MNVLMLAPEFLPIWGGVGTYIVEIARNMPRNVQIHILTPKRTSFNSQKLLSKPSNDEQSKMFPENVVIHYIGSANDTFYYNFKFQLNCFRCEPSIVNKYNIDVIHSQSAMPDLFLPLRKLNIPIITTIHSTIKDQIMAVKSSGTSFFQLEFSEKMTLILGPVLKFLEAWYYNGNRYYITVSKWMKDRIIQENKKLTPNRVKVIYNGVDTNAFHPSKRKYAKKYFPELADIDLPKVLYLSRFVELKGIRFLLKAIPQILEKTDVHFIFAGAGKNITLDISKENYTFLGYIPHEITPYVYSLSDIFVLPSLYENFPLSVLEAMSSGLAVIATNVGGIPEMITHNENGILIPPRSSKDIARSVVNLVEDDQLRKELGVNARKTVEKKFSWKIAALRTKEYYERVLENEGSAR